MRVLPLALSILWSQASWGMHPLVGTWRQMVKALPLCAETHTYRPDGTLTVISGQEVTEQTYRLVPLKGESNRFTLTSTILKDSGGADCLGDQRDSFGQKATGYVTVRPDGNVILMCYSPKQESCWGVFQRISH